MINWLFFDVGNVIFNDDPAMAKLYQYIYEVLNQNGKDVTFEELLHHRENAILENCDGSHYKTVGNEFLGEKKFQRELKTMLKKLSDDWAKFSPLMPEIVPLIQQLSTRFKLGLIANQPRVTESILENYQLMQYFKVNCISAFVGCKKPNKNIFEQALKFADCRPEDAVMVGDRLDNDVAPAKAMGMKTIWLKLSLEKKGYEPVTEFEKLYFKSIRKACVSQLLPQNEEQQPDFIAESYDDIIEILKKVTD